MIAGSYVIVTIILNTFLSIFPIKIKFFKDLFIQFIIDRHFLFSWEIAHISISVFNLQWPGVVSNVIHSKSTLWIGI